MQAVIPEMTVYEAMTLIRKIDDKKQTDIEKKQKKAEERAALGLSEEEEEELKLDIPQPVVKPGSRKKKVEIDPEIIERAREVALLKRELATYGVSWTNTYFIVIDNKCFCLIILANMDLGELLPRGWWPQTVLVGWCWVPTPNQ